MSSASVLQTLVVSGNCSSWSCAHSWIATALLMYAQDHEELLPSSATVWGDVSLDKGIFVCPTSGKKVPNGYLYLGGSLLSERALGDIPTPSSTPMTVDSVGANRVTHATAGLVDLTADVFKSVASRHSGGATLSYCDGHVQVVKPVSAGTFAPCLSPNDTMVPLEVGKLSAANLPVRGDTGGSFWPDAVRTQCTALGLTTLIQGGSAVTYTPSKPSWIESVTTSGTLNSTGHYLDWNGVVVPGISMISAATTFTITPSAVGSKKIAIIASGQSSMSQVQFTASSVNGKAFTTTFTCVKNNPTNGVHYANGVLFYATTAAPIVISVTAKSESASAAINLAVEP